MLSDSDTSFSESEIEMSELNSSYGEQEEHDSSDESSTSDTIMSARSLRSCSESELSIRTGSTAFRTLPPRPVPPPPPPPSLPMPGVSSDRCSRRTICSPVPEPSLSVRAAPGKEFRSASVENSTMSRTLSIKKKPRLSRTRSSDTFSRSRPCDQMSRTFSSEGLRKLLLSLPPAYPPPLPPGSATEQSAPAPPTLPPPYEPLQPSAPSLPIPQIPQRPVPPIPNNATSTSSIHEYSESHSRRRRTCLKRRSLILITLMSLTLSLASCCFAAYNFILYTLPVWMKQETISPCILCSSFNSSTLRESCQVSGIDTEEGKQFCARSSGEISDLLHMIINRARTFNVTEPPASPELRISSAHKYLQKSDSNEPRRLKFELENDRFEYAQDVKVKNNSLQINKNGWYFVYAGVHFRGGPRTTCSTDKEWSYSVIQERMNNNIRNLTILTHSAHSCVKPSDSHTGYTGGVFKLYAGDAIFVNVSDPHVFHFQHEGSYLGLVMVNP